MSHPTRTAPSSLGFNAAWEWQQVYARAFKDAMLGGACVFGKPRSESVDVFDSEPEWQNDQELDVFAAVRDALRCPGHDPESVGTAVIMAVARIASDYASAKADEAAELVSDDGDAGPDLCDYDRSAA